MIRGHTSLTVEKIALSALFGLVVILFDQTPGRSIARLRWRRWFTYARRSTYVPADHDSTRCCTSDSAACCCNRAAGARTGSGQRRTPWCIAFHARRSRPTRPSCRRARIQPAWARRPRNMPPQRAALEGSSGEREHGADSRERDYTRTRRRCPENAMCCSELSYGSTIGAGWVGSIRGRHRLSPFGMIARTRRAKP